MAGSEFSAGYLAEAEASHLSTEAIAGAVIVHLRRDIGAETSAGRPVRQMFVELSISEAVQYWRHLGEVIRFAGAADQQGDAAPLL